MSSASSTRRVLVTGGAGFIGSHACVELLSAGFEVVCVDNLVNSVPASLERVKQITGKTVVFHLVDLCNSDALELVFKKSPKFDAVIHFAGLKAVGESVQLPLLYYSNNITGTLNLLNLMEKYECRNIIFSSSATVYGSAAPPIREDAPLSCTNAYGRTKLFIEEILRDLSRSPLNGSKWRIILLRYFNPVGAHPSGLIGEDPEGPPNNLMPYVAQVAVGRRPFLSVFGADYDTPDGTGVRDYIHVVDLARGHLAALQQGLFGAGMLSNCEVFNLGSGKGHSVLEMVKAMSDASGRKIEYKIVDRRPGDVAVNFADPSKAEKQLGWKAQFGLKQMVEDLWRWQRMNPEGFKGALVQESK